MQVMEPSSPIASCFSCKSWQLVRKVQNNSYAQFEDQTYQLLRLYLRVLLACCLLLVKLPVSGTVNTHSFIQTIRQAERHQLHVKRSVYKKALDDAKTSITHFCSEGTYLLTTTTSIMHTIQLNTHHSTLQFRHGTASILPFNLVHLGNVLL